MNEEKMSEEPKSIYEAAINNFWAGRNSQAAKQQGSGRLDAGLRGAVTGGGHLDGVRDLLAELFLRYGFPEESIRRKQNIVLPGYYRPTKEWDLLVIHENMLVAAIELKSQVGPSFGNNFNNRTEEALGNAVDVWRAYEEGTFGDIRPWLGYVFVLEESLKSTKPVSVKTSLFPADKIFTDTSYKDRYSILCDRLVKERLYDAAWFITSTKEGISNEPSASLSFTNFEAAIAGRAAYIHALA
jgi:hypothetical protein